MKTLRILLLLLPFLGVQAFAEERVNGWCEDGKKTINVNTVTSSVATPVQRSYPNCRVTVYLTGTTMLAVLHSDNSGTHLDNPFTAQGSTGQYYFYTANDRYDVQTSGAGMPAPVTVADVFLQDGFHIPGVWDVNAPEPTIAELIALNATIGSGIDHKVMLFQITNVPGFSPSAVVGDIIVPQSATIYGTSSVFGLAFNNSVNANAVGGSFFSAATSPGDAGTGTVSSGVHFHRISGPPFQAVWTQVNTGIEIDGVPNGVVAVQGDDDLTLASATTGTAVPWVRRVAVWGINTLITNWLPGLDPTGGGVAHTVLINENDVNIGGPDAAVIGFDIGILGPYKPASAFAFIVNGGFSDRNGDPVRFDCAFCALDRTASVFAQIGVASHGEGGSMPIEMFSRDASLNVSAATMGTSSEGDLLLGVGGSITPGSNPGIIFIDSMSSLNFIVTGTATGEPATITAFNDGRFTPGRALFADLGTGAPGSILYCDDCQDVLHNHIVAGTQCIAGGTGANARASYGPGIWVCE